MGRKYTWLGGNVEPLIEPTSTTDVLDSRGGIDPAKWSAAWAARVERGHEPLHVSPLHRHSAACLGEELTTAGTDLFPPIVLRECSVLGAGKGKFDQRFMAFMGYAPATERA